MKIATKPEQLLSATDIQSPVAVGKVFGYFLISISILLQALASVFGKLAVIASTSSNLLIVMLNYWYWLELTALGLQAICWTLALRYFALSFAYPLTSLVASLILLSAWLFFGESIAMNHLIGIGVIMVGVALVSSEIRS